MQRNIVETVLGAAVLLVAGVFFIFAYQTGDVKTVEGYKLKARFTRIDGLETGSDVSISGVKVGTVLDFALNPETYLAEVTLSIMPSVKVPRDTAAVIASKGLLDGKYLALQPGGDEEMLADGETIEFTQSTPGLEQLLGQVIFSLNKGGKGEDEEESEEDSGASEQPAVEAPADAAPAESESQPETP